MTGRNIQIEWTTRFLMAVLLVSIFLLGGCSSSTSESDPKDPSGQKPVSSSLLQTPTEFKKGEALLLTHCAQCHGAGAVGTNIGPPLVHKIYEPNHHGDPSFHRAVQMGVQAHHWSFGNMPRIEGVGPGEVDAIVAYVRWLQRQAGIF